MHDQASAKRISILLPDLRPGGAERLHLSLANAWQRRGINVDFVLGNAVGELLDHLPAGSRVFDLGAPRVRNLVSPLMRYLRTERPHALLAAMWPLTVIAPLAARAAGTQCRVVVSEHAPQSLAYAHKGSLHHKVMRATMRVGYRLAHARVGVSGGVADDMGRLSAMDRACFKVVHNPAATGQVIGAVHAVPAALAERTGPILLAVGTLKAVKRHDLLIRAFANLRRPDATLCILGEGQERANLDALIVSLGLRDRVLLAGYQKDPQPWYAHANLFVLSSDHEGFGNVIVEALEHGLRVVSTDCPTGPHEILDEGKYGKLVPVGDVAALARAMKDSLTGAHDSEASRRRAKDFSVDKAANAYLELLLPNGGDCR
jgi:glycosyltransferase involved in cell wall biosynthesis